MFCTLRVFLFINGGKCLNKNLEHGNNILGCMFACWAGMQPISGLNSLSDDFESCIIWADRIGLESYKNPKP
jgi:hypothetical protein